jgi:hypothetical protein
VVIGVLEGGSGQDTGEAVHVAEEGEWPGWTLHGEAPPARVHPGESLVLVLLKYGRAVRDAVVFIVSTI